MKDYEQIITTPLASIAELEKVNSKLHEWWGLKDVLTRIAATAQSQHPMTG